VENRVSAPVASIPRRRRWRALALLVAIALAIWGQRMVERRDDPGQGLFLLMVAAGLFVGAARHDAVRAGAPGPASASRPLIAGGARRVRLLGAAAVLAAVAYLAFGSNRVSGIALTAWLLSLACFLAATAERPSRGSPAPRGHRRGRWGVRLALLAVGLLAAFFLFFRLPEVPAEMTSDHAEKLLDVSDVLRGDWSIFFRRNTGREPLQFYLTAALIRWTPLPLGHLALKAGTAFIGLLAVLFTFLLGRRLFGPRVGLLAAAFLAVSHWHLAVSRVGLRPPFTAAFALPALFFLFRALRENRRNDWLACGLILGFGLYGYTAFRIVPLLFIALIGAHALLDLGARLIRRGHGDAGAPGARPRYADALALRYWRNALVSGVAALLVFLPMLRYMVDDPRMFWHRALTRTGGAERALPSDLGSVLLENVKNALLMFNYRGDVVWVATVPFDPVLDWVTGGLFALGAAYLLWRVVAGGDRFSLYVVLALLMLLVPSTLNLVFPVENPSATRAAGAAPIAMLVAALPVAVAARRLRRDWGRAGRWAGTGLGLALVAGAAVLMYQWYFVKYDAQYRASSWNSRDMAAAIGRFVADGGDMRHAHHIGYPHWVDTRAIAINAGDLSWHNALTNPDEVRAHVSDPAAKLYLLHRDDTASLAQLETLFPAGRARLYRARTPGKDFVVFDVPASEGRPSAGPDTGKDKP
jgi:hypothetical protein